jgi:predicted membrane protein
MSDEKNFDRRKFKDDLRENIHNIIDESLKGGRRPMVVGIRLGKHSYAGGLIWGALLILVGLAFLLDHMGVINIDQVWRFWPLLLIVAGISNIVSPERRFWGIVLIAAGTFLQLNLLGLAHFGWADFWPVILISVGLMVIWNSLRTRNTPTAPPSEGGDPRLTVNGVAIFSGLERRMTTQDFQGGHVTAIFGGIELDLTEANMQAEEATLEVNAIFGGAEIRVPDTWQVSYRGGPIFGGVEDKTRIRRSEDIAGGKPKVLHITGLVAFGGLEIKN